MMAMSIFAKTEACASKYFMSQPFVYFAPNITVRDSYFMITIIIIIGAAISYNNI